MSSCLIQESNNDRRKESFDLQTELKLQVEREIKMKQYLYRKANMADSGAQSPTPVSDFERLNNQIP
jgi:hypothetical protein